MNARRLALLVPAGLCALAIGAGPAQAVKEHHPGSPPSFGAAGAKPGQLEEPSGVAIDDATGLEPAAGDVYVLDRGNNRVERFGGGGEYLGKFDGSGEFEVEGKQEKGAAAPTGGIAASERIDLNNGIAIDNSGMPKLEDPSVGDVYVVDGAHDVIDRFGPLGEYEAQLTGTCAEAGICPGKATPFSAIYGVAVDPSGDLWISYTNANTEGSVYVAEFTDTGSFVKAFSTGERGEFYSALAVDARYVYFSGARRGIDKFDAQTGEKVAEFDRLASTGAYGVTALAVQPATDDLFVVAYGSNYSEEDGDIEVFGPAGEPYATPLEMFPFRTHSQLEENIHDASRPRFQFNGIAVSQAGTVYASVRNAGDVATFEDVSLPEAQTTVVTQAGVTLRGSFDPEGASVSACQFEYVSDEAFKQARATEAEAREAAAQASGRAGEASSRATAARARAKAFAAEGRKERAAEEEAVAESEEELAKTEAARATAEEAGAHEQQGGWREVVAAECEPSAASISGSAGAVVLQARLTALHPRTTYHARLVAVAGGKTRSSGEYEVFTATRPLIEAQTTSEAGSTDVTVHAQIDPNGLPTRYHVEYGKNDAQELSTPEVDAGVATAPISVSVALSGLEPGTSYRFRFVASNALGAVTGEEIDFATQAAAVSGGPIESTCPNDTFSGFDAALPDCRAYELVSAAEDEAYVPDYGEYGSSITGEYEFVGNRAATTGNAVTYGAGPSASGMGGSGKTGNDDGNQYLSVRGAGGWEATNIEPGVNSRFGTEFEGFSEDLKISVFSSNAPEVNAQPAEPSSCATEESSALYSYAGGSDHALLSTEPVSGTCFASFAGISADDSHLLIASRNAFTAEATTGAQFGDNNLYDIVNGALHQVNVLPNGETETHPDATFGPQIGEAVRGYMNVVSTDGSRVFWTALGEGGEKLYVRENDAQPQSPVAAGRCTVPTDACTVQIDAAEAGAPGPGGEGRFWAASTDGARVFFTDQNRLTADATATPGEPDLYEYEVNGEAGAPGSLRDLTVDGHVPGHADVQGVIGVSEDGSYVYFVAEGVLAGTNSEGRAPAAGQPNLYQEHSGKTTLVATLSPKDNEVELNNERAGDWQLWPGQRSAEVTSGGRAVGFISTLSLTGYDNGGLPEVFVYDADSSQLACASCSPTGAVARAEGYVATSHLSTFMPRWINEREGVQAYFMTAQSLVAYDTNGLQDVYEWENQGSGECRQAGGCIRLLSSADSTSRAYFLDASADGANVFLTSRAQLVPPAFGETMKLYDARVDGGIPEAKFACTGTGCQGVPPAAPIFATPASVTFNGVGNFEPQPSPAVKQKAKAKKKLAKCKRGFARKHGRCVRKRSRRARGSAKRSSATRNGR